jgi:hypothetical protein
VRYPILPKITRVESQTAQREIAEIRHSSFYSPRDFDISPYFMVVKPTLARGFNYKDMHWADLPQVQHAQVSLAPEVEGAVAEVVYTDFPGGSTELRNAHAVSNIGFSTLSWIERGHDGEPGSPGALPLSVASRIDGR